MWIICCGLRRSGSTLQYNIAAKILALSEGKVLGYIDTGEDFLRLQEQYEEYQGYKLVKIHLPNEPIVEAFATGNAKGIFCYRDVRDVVVSEMAKYGFSFRKVLRLKLIEHYVMTYAAWKQLSPLLESKYEIFAFDIKTEVERIASFLTIHLTEQQVRTITEELTLENVKKYIQANKFDTSVEYNSKQFKMDASTLLHNNHINSGACEQWRTKLTDRQIRKVERRAKEWLAQKGYPLATNEKSFFWPW